jgi:hypothetical protein
MIIDYLKFNNVIAIYIHLHFINYIKLYNLYNISI